MRRLSLVIAMTLTSFAATGWSAALAPPAWAGIPSTCTFNAPTATVTIFVAGGTMNVGASGANITASPGGGNICPVIPVTTIGQVVITLDPSTTLLSLLTGAGSGFGPSVNGRAFLPVTINGGVAGTIVEIATGDATNKLVSFSQAVANPGHPWGIDLDAAQGPPDVSLDMAPQLRFAGGSGDDTFVLGAGRAEDAHGGGGADTATFINYPSGVAISLDDTANDGGEGDNVRTDVENVRGSEFADTITGDAQVNIIDAGAGNDHVSASDGDDQVLGGSGNDDLSGENGNDMVNGGLGDDQVLGGPGDDSLFGHLGNDVLVPGPGDDSVLGSEGNDITIADATLDGTDTVDGGAGFDAMSYTARTTGVTVTLNFLADDGQPGEKDNIKTEVVYGGAGNDVLNGSVKADYLRGGGGNDILRGFAGNDNLDGGTGNDALDGAAGNDMLLDSSTRPTSGTDTFVGGAGVDTASYAARTDAVSLSLDGLADDGAVGEGDSIGSDVENLSGSQGGSRLVGNGLANVLVGGIRTDSISGGDGNDVIRAGGGNDIVNGGAGNDVIIEEPTSSGSDNYYGSTGTDAIVYSARATFVSVHLDNLANDGAVGEGDNVRSDIENIFGGQGGNVLVGGPGPNSLFGGIGADSISAGDGNDVIRARNGNDIVNAGAGNDIIVEEPTSSGSDNYYGSTGTDAIAYSARTTFVSVHLDNLANDGAVGEGDNVRSDIENIFGGQGGNVLVGGPGPNSLFGGLGADSISAGDGNDVITPGRGNDIVNAGAGNDVIHEDATSSGSDTYFGSTGIDSVVYAARTSGISVNVDNIANDGAAGEGDNVRTDIENVYAGSGADHLTGSTVANLLSGGAGNDVLIGLGGADSLRGGDGNDAIFARDGVVDTIDGGTGSDRANVDAFDHRVNVETLF